MFKIFFALLTLMAVTANAEQASRIVTIEFGTIEGSLSGDVLSFKGVPYAAAPVARLRWRPPQPVTHWTGVRDATAFGSDCPQMDLVQEARFKGNEDCLFLNVWRPLNASGVSRRLPVLVWIYGGGNVTGGSSEAITDGGALARQGLVVVSFNYRLGRLGFFAHPALIVAHEGGKHFSGNFGLMDQIHALKWVRANIGSFGGDPDQVTVAGESAGGFSIMHLLTSPAATGLFQRAIMMSGGGRRGLLLRRMTGGDADKPSADMIGEMSTGIHGSAPEALVQLRELDAKDLVQDLTFRSVLQKLWDDDPRSSLVMIDGMIVTGEPGDLLCRGAASPVPVVIGTTLLDLAVFSPPRTEPFPYGYFGPDAAKAREIYGNLASVAAKGVGVDISMHEPARFVAKAVTATGRKAWLYRFSYACQNPLLFLSCAAWHAHEVPFLFQTLDRTDYALSITERDRRMARAFSGYFADFAKGLAPDASGSPEWAPFDPADFNLMEFTPTGPKFGPEPRKGVALVERVAQSCTQ